MAPLPTPHKTASGTLEAAPLVLIDIELDDDVVGSAYVFAYSPAALRPLANLVSNIADGLIGETGDPSAVYNRLDGQFRLLGNQGLVAMALSGIDMALWDALGKRETKPLCELLGGSPRPINVYDSLGQMPPDETAREVEKSLRRGFRAFKVKAGHEDANVDVSVVRAIREVAGTDVWVAIDFNQAFDPAEAVQRLKALEHENLAWIEEPVHATDFLGHAMIRSQVQMPVQTGENWWGVADMKKAIAAGASDFAMPDVMKIGGVTGWLEAGRIAENASIPIASHLFVEISSHLLSVTPTAMILEWFDIAGTIVANSPIVSEGTVTASSTAGIGVDWNEAAIAKLGSG